MQMKLAPWALLAVAAMWGISFVWMKDILDQQDVYSFLTSRFLVAAAAMILLKPKVLKAFNKELVFKGLIVGMALGSGYIFQTLGLERTTPAITGFITGLYVVFTPLLASIFLKERLTLAMWGYVFLAVLGLGILSVKGWSVGLGEIFVLISAVLFAFSLPFTLSCWVHGVRTSMLTHSPSCSSLVALFFPQFPHQSMDMLLLRIHKCGASLFSPLSLQPQLLSSFKHGRKREFPPPRWQ